MKFDNLISLFTLRISISVFSTWYGKWRLYGNLNVEAEQSRPTISHDIDRKMIFREIDFLKKKSNDVVSFSTSLQTQSLYIIVDNTVHCNDWIMINSFWFLIKFLHFFCTYACDCTVTSAPVLVSV